MGTSDSRVNHVVFIVRIFRQLLKGVLPDTFLTPAMLMHVIKSDVNPVPVHTPVNQSPKRDGRSRQGIQVKTGFH